MLARSFAQAHRGVVRISWWSWRDRLAVVAALLGPFAVCAVLAPFRTSVPNTDAALVLVAAVVAVAANGHRWAGLLAALSASVWFDFFLTVPVHRLAIDDRVDVETTLLLLVVGAAVTELAVRGRRSRQLAATDERFLAAIQAASTVATVGTGPGDLAAAVTTSVRDLLGLRACRFESTRFGGMPRLRPDGTVRVGQAEWDVDQYGLPDRELEVLVAVRGRTQGRLVLTPEPGAVPSLAARRCVGVLADLLAGGLAALRQPSR